MTRPRDAGFSLPELLVVIAVLGVIASILINAMQIGWRTYEQTSTLLSASGDQERLSIYFMRDVQSASTVETAGAGCLAGGDTLVVRVLWSDTDTAAVVAAKSVSYVTNGGVLYRRTCTGAATTDTLRLVQTFTVATATCLSAAYAAATCATAAVVRLTVTNGATSFYQDGRRRLP